MGMEKATETVPTPPAGSVDFSTALHSFLNFVKGRVDERYEKTLSELSRPTFTLDVGRKYIRIVCNRAPGSSRYVYGFVDATNGNLLKAAGWKAPALNFPRGNVFKPETWPRAAGDYGIG